MDPRLSRQGTIREGRRGERLTARRFSEPIRALNRMLGGAGQAQVVPSARLSASVMTTVRLTVVSVGEDYVVCQGLQDESGNEPATYYVALPYLLRRTPFDGESRDGISYSYTSNTARTADDGADTEDQVIVPSYVAGDQIVAARGIGGGTGVTATIDGIDTVLTLQDLNLDGRAWAKEA